MDSTKLRTGFTILFIALTGGIVTTYNQKITKPIETEHKIIVKTESISLPTEQYKSYQHIIQQLNRWHQESPSNTEIGVYGKTTKGTSCNYFRIGAKNKPKVLIHSGLVGNEEFPVLMNMHIIHKLLTDYETKSEIKYLLDNRDVYFVPVASPDTYLKSNTIEDIDPMTSFPTYKKMNPQTSSATLALMQWAENQKFKAVLNNHAPGEKILPPEICVNEDREKIYKIINKMISANGYLTSETNKNESTGNDTDWFYATGSCSIQMQWGKKSKQYISYSEVEPTLNRNYNSILIFIKEAIDINVSPKPLKAIYFYQVD